MYCKKCGKLLDAGDKFCSNCGTRVEEDFVPAFRKEEPQETPRTAQAQTQEQPEERPRRKIHIEEFNWDLDGYPTAQKKTEDIDFNWSSVLEERRQDRYGSSLQSEPAAQPDETGGQEAAEEAGEASLEDALFADMGSLDEGAQVDNDEPTRILSRRENRTEFYTYNKKNEALQAMLDKEYEKLRSGEEPEDEPAAGRAGAGDGRSPEEVMSDLLEKAEPGAGKTAGGQEAGRQPENPPCAEKEKVALEFVGVTLSGVPKGVMIQKEDAADGAARAGMRQGAPAHETAKAGQAAAASERKAAPKHEAGAKKKESCPPREEKAKEEHKLTFDDVFGDDDDSDENLKKGKVLKFIAAILCILVLAELAVIGIQYFAPESEAAKTINQAYGKVMDLFRGGDDADGDEPAQAPQNGAEEGPLAALIEGQKDKGENIVLIEEDQSLTFDDGQDYGFEDFGNAYTFDDKPWYTENGVDVTYGQELVGTLVQYYSLWIDKINGKNNKVLKVIDETSDFYAEIEELEGDKDLEYGMNRLAIGDIRVGNTGFYVRTSVTIIDSKKKEQQEEHIVYMEPDEKAMKIVAVKKI